MEEPDPPIVRAASPVESARRSDRIAVGSALVGGLLAAIFVAVRLTSSGGETHVTPDILGASATSQPVRVQTGAQASPLSAPSPVAAASPSPRSDTPVRARIANTDGQGVALRASPRDDDRTPRGFLEGDAVTVLERSGSDWARVRGDNGQEGWVPTRYLGP